MVGAAYTETEQDRLIEEEAKWLSTRPDAVRQRPTREIVGEVLKRNGRKLKFGESKNG